MILDLNKSAQISNISVQSFIDKKKSTKISIKSINILLDNKDSTQISNKSAYTLSILKTYAPILNKDFIALKTSIKVFKQVYQAPKILYANINSSLINEFTISINNLI